MSATRVRWDHLRLIAELVVDEAIGVRVYLHRTRLFEGVLMPFGGGHEEPRPATDLADADPDVVIDFANDGSITVLFGRTYGGDQVHDDMRFDSRAEVHSLAMGIERACDLAAPHLATATP